MCNHFLWGFSETFVILRRAQRDIIANVHGTSYQVPVIIFIRFYGNCS